MENLSVFISGNQWNIYQCVSVDIYQCVSVEHLSVCISGKHISVHQWNIYQWKSVEHLSVCISGKHISVHQWNIDLYYFIVHLYLYEPDNQNQHFRISCIYENKYLKA